MYSLIISFIVANCVLTVFNKDNDDDDICKCFVTAFTIPTTERSAPTAGLFHVSRRVLYFLVDYLC